MKVLVVGGGFAGLGAAQTLCEKGIKVTLVEQGRGLGGRVCSRHTQVAQHKLTFDHGCQYLSPKSEPFKSVIKELHANGLVAPWGDDGTVGDMKVGPLGQLDLSSFAPYPASKAMYVGVPTNSAVGRYLATKAGDNLTVHTGTRVNQLIKGAASGHGWGVQASQRGPGNMLEGLNATSFDAVITAMSSRSTVKLLSDIAPEVAAEAGNIQANACWALMVAFSKPTGLPFNGALLQGSSSIAWLARDSSKPSRGTSTTQVAYSSPPQGSGSSESAGSSSADSAASSLETWVVHASPDWSNARREADPQQVAQELLAEFISTCGLTHSITSSDIVYLEAHLWTNAYPLNPRASAPLQGSQLPGHFLLLPELRLGACGDWCFGPRASDAYASGVEAASAMLDVLR